MQDLLKKSERGLAEKQDLPKNPDAVLEVRRRYF